MSPLVLLALTKNGSPFTNLYEKESHRKVSFFSFEQHMALLDFISSAFTKYQVTSFCSVGMEGTVVVEGGAQGKGIVMGCLNAEQN